MSAPSDDEIRQTIKKLVAQVDLESTGFKHFFKLLSKELGNVDLKPRKGFVKQTLTEILSEEQDNDENDAEEEEDASDAEESEESEVEDVKPKKKGGGGLAAEKKISDKLAAFLGKGKMMARKDIVKELWVYIRKHNLQNPEKKQEIILDKKMKKVFGCDTFTMFTMNKYIGAHIDPFKPVDLTKSPSKAAPKKRKASTRKGGGPEKKRKAGTQPPYRLSPELQAVVGASVLPRPQVVSKIWEYIKAKGLQNPENKREIICDARLKAIMKKDKVTMFTMNTFISPHLLERAEKGEYQHDEEGQNQESEEDEEEE